MRLSFANGEHADFPVEGNASLGSAEGNSLVLHGGDVAARHARLSVDRRGIVLEVLDPAARTHVNARPVREKALLRCGDVLCLGRVAIILAAGPAEVLQPPPPPAPLALRVVEPAEVVLRGVSGRHFGRCMAVNPRLLVGPGADCGLRIDAPGRNLKVAIETVGGAIHLRAVEGRGGVRVNGIPADEAIVYPGDQLTIGRSQFLIEAPGLPRRGQDGADTRAITETLVAVPDSPGVPERRGRSGIWWLLGAAAALALLSVLLIQHGP